MGKQLLSGGLDPVQDPERFFLEGYYPIEVPAELLNTRCDVVSDLVRIPILIVMTICVSHD